MREMANILRPGASVTPYVVVSFRIVKQNVKIFKSSPGRGNTRRSLNDFSTFPAKFFGDIDYRCRGSFGQRDAR